MNPVDIGNWSTKPSSSLINFSYILAGDGALGSLSCGSLFFANPSLLAGQVGNIVGSIGSGVSLKNSFFRASSALILLSGSYVNSLYLLWRFLKAYLIKDN